MELERHIKESFGSPDFYEEVFESFIQKQNDFISKLFNLKEEFSLSKRCDLSGIHSGYLLRARSRPEKIATFLIDNSGHFLSDRLAELITQLEKHGNIPYPRGFSDGHIHAHLLKQLKRLLEENSPLLNTLLTFTLPLGSRFAEEIILNESRSPLSTSLTLPLLRRAILSALLTPLHQDVGSCFATAPAILIQDEQPLEMLVDFFNLLYTGRITRVIEGVEYSVPISPKRGSLGNLLTHVNFDKGVQFSPVLHIACEELFPVNMEFNQRCEWLRNKLLLCLEKQKTINLSQFIKYLFFEGAPINEKGFSSQVNDSTFQTEIRATKASDLAKSLLFHPLLKTWEYSLASLAESKMEFVDWNLYKGLGLHPREIDGLGSLLVEEQRRLLEDSEKSLEMLKDQYEVARLQLETFIASNGRAGIDESRASGEEQSRTYYLKQCADQYNEAFNKIKYYRDLPELIGAIYCEKFQDFFQEVYDPELYIESEGEGVFEDRPAGFRLIYKRGRRDPTTWSLVENGEQYCDFLIDFFRLTEREIESALNEEGVYLDYGKILNQIIEKVRSSGFLESSIQRLGGKGRLPWASISGGTIGHLLQAYFRKSSPLFYEKIAPENELELAIMLIDLLKKVREKAISSRILLTSAVHAFAILPEIDRLTKLTLSSTYTYTLLKESLIQPAEQFYKTLFFSEKEQEFIFSEFLKRCGNYFYEVPYYARMVHREGVSFQKMRQMLLELGAKIQNRSFDEREAIVDSFLMQTLPLHSGYGWKGKISDLLEDMGVQETVNALPEIGAYLMSFRDLLELAAAVILIAKGALIPGLFLYLRTRAERLLLAPPFPLFFADTNWPENLFAFIYNSGSERIEMWRFDECGMVGYPMSSHRHLLTGKPNEQWKIFTRPYEYRMRF